MCCGRYRWLLVRIHDPLLEQSSVVVGKRGSNEIMVVKIPRPDVDGGGDGEEGQEGDGKVPLPMTLVRIPVGEEERGLDGSGEEREGGG